MALFTLYVTILAHYVTHVIEVISFCYCLSFDGDLIVDLVLMRTIESFGVDVETNLFSMSAEFSVEGDKLTR